MAIEIRNRLPQCIPCFFKAKSLRNHPDAKLFALKACLEIEHQRFKQILLRLVEGTEMCSPAHVTDGADTRFSQRAGCRFGCHSSVREADIPSRQSVGVEKKRAAPQLQTSHCRGSARHNAQPHS